MPGELLPRELETADSLLDDLEKIDDHLRRAARLIGQSLEQLKGMALAFKNAWRQIVANVAKGQTAEMQAERMGLLNEYKKRLNLLKKSYALLTIEQIRGEIDFDPDFLLTEIAGMERLKARVFDHWQSAEDLEDLAARDYPLKTAELDQIGPQRQPPASWYEEDTKPF